MRKVVMALVLCAAGCGDGPSAPGPAQSLDAAGVWRGSLRVTSGTGEACVASAFQSAAGVAFDYTLTVRQTGQQLMGTSTSVATGITCQLSGTAGTSSFTMNMSSCESGPPRFFSCDGGTVSRDARPSGLMVSATVTGNSATATYVETYDVSVSGTTTSLGPASVNAQLTLSR